MLQKHVIETYHEDLESAVREHGLDLFRMQPPKPSPQKTLRVCCGGPPAARIPGFSRFFSTTATSVRTDNVLANNSLIGYMLAQVVLLFFRDRVDFKIWASDSVEADFLRLTQPVNVAKRFVVLSSEWMPEAEIQSLLGSDNVTQWSVDFDGAVRDLGLPYAIDPYIDAVVMVPSGWGFHGLKQTTVELPDDARGLFLSTSRLTGTPSRAEGAVLYGCVPDVQGATNIRPGSSQEQVTVIDKPFLIAQSATTRALWACAMKGQAPTPQEEDDPVAGVPWTHMLRLSNALSRDGACYTGIRKRTFNDGSAQWDHACTGFRLPTEREWEYAARAFSGFEYSGGDVARDVGWHSGNARGRVHAVGQLDPNAFGTYDMSGNVSEWCWDLFSGTLGRGIRGGSFDGSQYFLSVGLRGIRIFDEQERSVGGRLVKSIL